MRKEVSQNIDRIERRQYLKRRYEKRHNLLFSIKEVLERIGYGFVTPQFINILFLHSGAGLFLIGAIHGLRNLLTTIISSITSLYGEHHKINTKWMSFGGISFGFSFLFMAFARLIKSPLLFSLSLLIGSTGIVAFGDIYKRIYNSALSFEKRNIFLQRAVYYGILITVVSMLISGYVMDLFPETGTLIAGMKMYGYLISFEITAFVFIIAEYILSRVKDRRQYMQKRFAEFLKTDFKTALKSTWRNITMPGVFLLVLTTMLVTILQVVGSAYYGIYIYNKFEGFLFGKYLNVAVIYAVGALIGTAGYILTKKTHRSTGISPLFVFSAFLMAILPFVLVFNPHFLAITAAVACMFIGGVIIGNAHNLLINRLVSQRARKTFYYTHNLFIFLPALIIITAGAKLTEIFGMKVIFLTIGGSFVFLVAPLYFILVLYGRRIRE